MAMFYRIIDGFVVYIEGRDVVIYGPNFVFKGPSVLFDECMERGKYVICNNSREKLSKEVYDLPKDYFFKDMGDYIKFVNAYNDDLMGTDKKYIIVHKDGFALDDGKILGKYGVIGEYKVPITVAEMLLNDIGKGIKLGARVVLVDNIKEWPDIILHLSDIVDYGEVKVLIFDKNGDAVFFVANWQGLRVYAGNTNNLEALVERGELIREVNFPEPIPGARIKVYCCAVKYKNYYNDEVTVNTAILETDAEKESFIDLPPGFEVIPIKRKGAHIDVEKVVRVMKKVGAIYSPYFTMRLNDFGEFFVVGPHGEDVTIDKGTEAVIQVVGGVYNGYTIRVRMGEVDGRAFRYGHVLKFAGKTVVPVYFSKHEKNILGFRMGFWYRGFVFIQKGDKWYVKRDGVIIPLPNGSLQKVVELSSGKRWLYHILKDKCIDSEFYKGKVLCRMQVGNRKFTTYLKANRRGVLFRGVRYFDGYYMFTLPLEFDRDVIGAKYFSKVRKGLVGAKGIDKPFKTISEKAIEIEDFEDVTIVQFDGWSIMAKDDYIIKVDGRPEQKIVDEGVATYFVEMGVDAEDIKAFLDMG